MTIDTVSTQEKYKICLCAIADCHKSISMYTKFIRFILPFKPYRVSAFSTDLYFDNQYRRHNLTRASSLSVSCKIYSIAYTYLNGVCIYKVEMQ